MNKNYMFISIIIIAIHKEMIIRGKLQNLTVTPVATTI